MAFSSVIFLSFFLPIVLGLYFFARDSLRNYVLLVSSLLFYAWGEPKNVFVMVFLIVISWHIALKIQYAIDNASLNKIIHKKKLWLCAGIIINLSVIFFYKYSMFFLENINYFSQFLNFEPFNVPFIALPIGISFYVFQVLSYLIDVYRGAVVAQKSLLKLAVYVSLFPQLVAGPIVRYQTIVEDIEDRSTSLENIYIGLRRFVIGLAKKVLIADQMAFIADKIFDAPVASVPCGFAWIGSFAYMLQIYYDFSGYSDMAIGIGHMFNFHFLENFKFPYAAQSVQDFWRRWHISLSSWLKDYLYIPLGGNKKGKIRTLINNYIIFILCGLWHGATWDFIIWGLYHGTMLVIERLGLNRLLEKLPRIIRYVYVWLFVLVGWVIFRTHNLEHALNFLKIMFLGNSVAPLRTFYTATLFLTYSNFLIFVFGAILAFPSLFKWYEKFQYKIVDSFFVFILFIVSYSFALTSTFSPFIYFRF